MSEFLDFQAPNLVTRGLCREMSNDRHINMMGFGTRPQAMADWKLLSLDICARVLRLQEA